MKQDEQLNEECYFQKTPYFKGLEEESIIHNKSQTTKETESKMLLSESRYFRGQKRGIHYST